MDLILTIAGYSALVILGLLVLAIVPVVYVVRQMSKRPDNNPEAFVKRGGKAPASLVVVCVGASIVQGRVCPSFVDLLAERLKSEGYVFVNAGVNGDTSLHVRRRLDPIIACDPDYVVILVGTNDITGTIHPGAWRAYRGEKRLPGPPTIDFYRENLHAIIRQLKERTRARVAICSLPVMGEDLSAPVNDQVRRFSEAISQVCKHEGAAYLPVYEQEERVLSERGRHTGWQGRAYSGNPSESVRLGFLGGFEYYLFRQSSDEIAHRRRFILKTDYLHGNHLEAEIIAGEVEAFLRSVAHPSEEGRLTSDYVPTRV